MVTIRRWVYNAWRLEEFCPVPEPKPCPDEMIEPAKIFGEITGAELIDLLPQEVEIKQDDGTIRIGQVRKTVWDLKYYLTSREEIERFLWWNEISGRRYIPNDYDCNRFAVSTWGDVAEWTPGICFGLKIIPNHALNWFVDWKKDLYSVEPQDDGIILSRKKNTFSFFI